MSKRAFLASLTSSLLLGLLSACGGSSSGVGSAAKPASALAYTNPLDSSGWRLVKDASSTPARLVLDLVGPAGLKSRGAGFNLQAPASVHFGHFTENGLAIKDTGVYELLNTDPSGDPLEPVLLAGGVKKGNLLTAGIFQKDRRASAKDSGSPLCQIVLELNPAALPAAGETIALTVPKARYMAEDIGAFSITPTDEMAQKAHLVPMTVAVGGLHAE